MARDKVSNREGTRWGCHAEEFQVLSCSVNLSRSPCGRRQCEPTLLLLFCSELSSYSCFYFCNSQFPQHPSLLSVRVEHTFHRVSVILDHTFLCSVQFFIFTYQVPLDNETSDGEDIMLFVLEPSAGNWAQFY